MVVAPSPPQIAPGSRRIELLLGAVIVVFLGLVAYGVYDLANGTGAKRAGGTATLESTVATTLGADNPSLVPLRTSAAIGSGWNVRVASVLRNVSQSVLGITHKSGAQNIVVEYTLSYGKAGRGNSQAVLTHMKAIGAANTLYAPEQPCLGRVGRSISIAAGHAITRAACFTVASSDAPSLELVVDDPGFLATGRRTWFALH